MPTEDTKMRAIEEMRGFGKLFLAVGPLAAVLVLLWMGGAIDGLAQSPAPEPHDDLAEADVYFLGSPGESAYLGVSVEEETEHDEGGARVTRVVVGSPAGEAGLQGGDIVVGFDGETIRGPVGLTKKIHARKPGDRVVIVVLRDGKRKKLEAELGDRTDSWKVMAAPEIPEIADIYVPELDEEMVLRLEEGLAEREEVLAELEEKLQSRMLIEEGLAEREKMLQLLHHCDEENDEDCFLDTRRFFVNWGGKPVLGVQLVEVTPELRQHLGADEETGVLVSKVLHGTPAERAGIHVGDLIVAVDGDEIENSADLRRALMDKVGETFDVEVIRDGTSVRIEVTIPEPENDWPSGPRAHAMPAPGAPPAPVAPRAVPAAPRAPRNAPAAPAAPATPEENVEAAREAERLARAEAREMERMARERAREAALAARAEEMRARAEALRAYERNRGDARRGMERARQRAPREYERALRLQQRSRPRATKPPVLL
jgi:membrane-associated protease RseP (regulator of RpoE activity)